MLRVLELVRPRRFAEVVCARFHKPLPRATHPPLPRCTIAGTEYAGRTRLRIRNGWTSAARKPDLNRSLTTKPECGPYNNQH